MSVKTKVTVPVGSALIVTIVRGSFAH
jgi:hypothetical protein